MEISFVDRLRRIIPIDARRGITQNA